MRRALLVVVALLAFAAAPVLAYAAPADGSDKTSSCRAKKKRKKANKAASKDTKKDKDSKKPYGFEL